MKRNFFLLIALIAKITILSAQDNGMDNADIIRLSSPLTYERDTKSTLIVESLIKKEKLVPGVSKDKPDQLRSLNSSSLAGIYEAVGYDGRDGKKLYWEIEITQDANDPTTFWFENIIDNATVNNIYGTLSGNQLSIPVGQITVPKENTSEKLYDALFAAITDKGELRWGGSPVVARVSFGQGTITFKEGFASVIIANNPSFTFFGRIAADPSAIFTNYEGGTGEADPIPSSLYLGPEGIMYLSMSKEWISLSENYAFAPPYSNWTFNNQTDEVSNLATKWTYNAIPDLSTGTILDPGQTSTQRDLSYPVLNQVNLMPKLESIMPKESSVFTLGATNAMGDPNGYGAEGYTVAYIEAGGGAFDDGSYQFNITNLNPDYDIYPWAFSKDDYAFGTGSSCNCSSLISFFEGSPDGIIYFEGVDVFFGRLTGPESTELKLEVVKAEKTGNGKISLGEVYGTATLKISDKYVLSNGSSGTLSFKDFYINSQKLDHFEIEGPFALVLSGFNVSGVQFAVVSEFVKRPDNLNYSYIIDKNTKEIDYYLDVHNTMYFALVNGAYPYLHADIDTINAGNGGGTYNVELISYSPTIELISSKPSWFTITQTDNTTDGYRKSNIRIDVDPLPVGLSGRKDVLEYSTKGAKIYITVAQGDNVGITEPKTPQIIVTREAENFRLSYPAGITSVSIYSLTGQKLATYPLSQTGTDFISHSNLERGIYILRFENSNLTTKVVK